LGEENEGNIIDIEKMPQQCTSTWSPRTVLAGVLALLLHLSDYYHRAGYAFAGFCSGLSQDQQEFEDIDGVRREADALAKKSGDFLQFEFTNDASPSQTVLESYDAANLREMRNVSRQYDSDRVY
jgi:hypothetical protein